MLSAGRCPGEDVSHGRGIAPTSDPPTASAARGPSPYPRASRAAFRPFVPVCDLPHTRGEQEAVGQTPMSSGQ